MLLLVLTSYLFVQGPRLWAWRNFVLSPKAIPRFRPFSIVRPTQVFAFSKKSYEEGHCQFTLQYSRCFVIFFSLFTFEFNHVLSFPGSACYYAEVLGLLVLHFFGLFSLFRPTDRPKFRERIRNKKKGKGLRGSTSKQHTINLVPRAFSMAWEGKRPWDQS